MKDRSPCLGCKRRSPGCQCKCQIGSAYFEKAREQNETIRKARDRESLANSFTIGQMIARNGRGGLET